MYDYATVTKQNEIITEIQTLDSELISLNNSISFGFYSIFFIIVFIFLFFFIRSLLGGNCHD